MTYDPNNARKNNYKSSSFVLLDTIRYLFTKFGENIDFFSTFFIMWLTFQVFIYSEMTLKSQKVQKLLHSRSKIGFFKNHIIECMRLDFWEKRGGGILSSTVCTSKLSHAVYYTYTYMPFFLFLYLVLCSSPTLTNRLPNYIIQMIYLRGKVTSPYTISFVILLVLTIMLWLDMAIRRRRRVRRNQPPAQQK